MSTVEEALTDYYEANGFPSDGGYSQDFFDVKIGPIRTVLPNGAGRRRALHIHDIHHLVTGHATTFRGETENAAWEVGGGCGDHRTAWVLDLIVLAPGAILWPRQTWKAFLTGRRTGNFYGTDLDNLRARSISELRASLGLDIQDSEEVATVDDVLRYLGVCATAIPVAAGGLVASVVLIPIADWRHRRRTG